MRSCLALSLVILGLCSYAAAKHQIKASDPGYEVVHITEIVRHGARTTYNSILQSPLTALLGQSELTPNGMIMHYVLGRELREMYPQLFNDKTTDKEINLYVSPVPRCIQSAMSQLFGLFPQGSFDKPANIGAFSPAFTNMKAHIEEHKDTVDFKYGPFKLQINQPTVDTTFSAYMGKVCPVSDTYRLNLYNQAAPKYDAICQELSKELREAGYDSNVLVNATNFKFDQLTFIYDEVEGYLNFYGKLLPGISNSLYKKLYSVANLYYTVWYGDAKFAQVVTNRMARQVMEGLENRVEGGRAKFNLYSGHNTNIHAFSILLGLTNTECMYKGFTSGKQPLDCVVTPGYASSYIFELNKKHDHYFVRTLLDGKPVKICAGQQDDYCSFSNFKQNFESKVFYQGDDLAAFCGNPKVGGQGEPLEQQSAYLYLLAFVVLLGLVTLAESMRRKFTKKSSKGKADSAGFAELDESIVV